jgi:hypothetical protein
MPIIGPLLSLFDAYNSFNKGNLIEGLNNLLQGAIGLLPIPKGMKVALFTGMDVLSVFLQEKYGKETKLHRDGTESFYIDGPCGQHIEIITFDGSNWESETASEKAV